MVKTPRIPPMRLVRLPAAFDDPDWLFEIKHDGYRQWRTSRAERPSMTACYFWIFVVATFKGRVESVF